MTTVWHDLPPGDAYHPSTGCWLLVTSLDEVSPVTPGILLICLENLRTLEEFEDTLCFHLADIYRGNFLSQHWLQLLAIIFCCQAKIRLIDKYMYTFENPTTVLEALSVVHDWSCTIWETVPYAEQYGKTAKPFSIISHQVKTIKAHPQENY